MQAHRQVWAFAMMFFAAGAACGGSAFSASMAVEDAASTADVDGAASVHPSPDGSLPGNDGPAVGSADARAETPADADASSLEDADASRALDARGDELRDEAAAPGCSSTCAGCCDSLGGCYPGNSPVGCGSHGAACIVCGGTKVCNPLANGGDAGGPTCL